jgi:drug/metabolite transporter (DMT)-like permease
MIPLFFILALFAQCALVTGQILLKRAVALPYPSRRRRAAAFARAIAFMTLYFFIWLAVAGYIPLTQLAPFDALGPLLLVAAVQLTLHERLPFRAWLGIAFILLGVTLISLS